MRADWLGPALAVHVPRLAAAYRLELRLPERDRVALTFDDGPHPQGTPAVLAELGRAGAGRRSSSSASRSRADPALAREVADAGHEIALHGYRQHLLLRRRVASSPPTSTGRGARSPTRPGSTAALPPAVRRLQLRRARARPRARLAPLLWSRWGRDWGAAPPRRRSRGVRRAGLGAATSCCCTTPTPTARAGLLAETAAALPSVLDTVATLGVPSSPVTQST